METGLFIHLFPNLARFKDDSFLQKLILTGGFSFCSTLFEERMTVFSKSSSTAPISIRHFSRIFTRILWMASFSFSSPERLPSRLSIRFHSQMGSVHIHPLKTSNSLFRFR